MSDPAGPCSLAAFLLILSGCVYAQTAALPSVSETELDALDDSPEKHRTERLLSLLNSGGGRLQLTCALLLLASLTLLESSLSERLGTALRIGAGGGAAVILLLYAILAPTLTVLLPGSIAAAKPKAVLHATSAAASATATLLSPLTCTIELLARLLLMPVGLSPALVAQRPTEDEIVRMVDLGEERGTIETDEKEMIENVFEFNNRTAADCMIHRKDISALPSDSTDAHILSMIRATGLSRFPVYRDTVDNIIGVLIARDYLMNRCAPKPREWQSLLRKAHFVPESVRADTLFSQMQTRKQHMAIVLDEYGGTAGLITLEDLLEEIVGNIYDEFDPKEEQDIARIDSTRWRVSGSAELEDINDTLGTDYPTDEDFDTLGGLIFSRLTEIPADGATPTVECFGTRICVTGIEDRRVEWAVIELLTGDSDEITTNTDR